MKTINNFITRTLYQLKKSTMLTLNWFMELNALKITALIVVNCFLLTSVYGEAVAAITDNARAVEKFKQVFDDFTLPYSYGKITSSNFAGSDTVVINIQDLHSHPRVQKNISKIIDVFDKKYGVKDIYLEGAYGQLDTSWLSSSDDKNLREWVLESLIDSGRLTGAEYYSVVSGRPNIIKGLENEKEYLENLRRFGTILEAQDEISIILNSISEDINTLKKQYYTRQQKKLDELSQQYVQGKIAAKKYFTLLYKHTEKLGIDIYKYENINTYKSLLDQERDLDYKRISAELSMLIIKLKEILPYQAYKMIVDNTENFSEIDKLYVYLIRFSKEYGINLEINFSALSKFLNYVELSQKINPLELIKEESKLVDEINENFSSNTEERNVVSIVSFQKYLRDFMSSKITSDDYKYYEANKKEFQTLWVKYIDNTKLELLDEYRKIAEEFYKVNIDRNKYFFDNIDGLQNTVKLSEDNISENDTEKVVSSLKNARNIYVIVTGGFHTQGVSQYLAEKGISTITITPNVTDGVKAAEETYYKIAKEQSKVLFQTLATLPLTQFKNSPESAAELVNAMITGSQKADRETIINRVNEFISDMMKKEHGETAAANIKYNSDDDIKLDIYYNGKRTVYSYDGKQFVNPIESQDSKQMSVESRNPILVFSAVASVAASAVALITTLTGGFLYIPIVAIISGLVSLLVFGFERGIQSKIKSSYELAKAKMTETGSGRKDFRILQKILASISPDLQKKLISKMFKDGQPLAEEKIIEDILADISAVEKLYADIKRIDDELGLLSKDVKIKASKQKRKVLNAKRNAERNRKKEEKDALEKELYKLEASLSARLSESVSDNTIAMFFDGTIHLNYQLLSVLFFNDNGQIQNINLLEVFIRHELRHVKFAEDAEKKGSFQSFVKRNKIDWLEELVVSLGDFPSFISIMSSKLFASIKNNMFISSALSFVSKFRRAPNSIDSDLEEGFRKYLDEFYEKDGIKDAG
ncbi:MAG: hypothetical protein LBD46_00675, partial [Endomicrobium sp.]|nr:hypothetical protein [Endomicrobium sp.]